MRTEIHLQIPNPENEEYMNSVIKRVLVSSFDDAEDKIDKVIERSTLPRGGRGAPDVYNIQTAYEICLLKIDDAREMNGIDRKYPTLVKKYS